MTEQLVTEEVIGLVRDLIDRHPLRALDAIQLATCCTIPKATEATEIVFVASDQQLLSAAQSEGISIFDPSQIS